MNNILSTLWATNIENDTSNIPINKHSLWLLTLILIGCNPFDSDRVLDYQTELIEIINLLEDHENITIHADDERFEWKMKSMQIDYLVKNQTRNKEFSGFIEESDSLVIFIRKSSNLFEPEERIIYDFAVNPRNFGSEEISNTAYERKQLDPRWYFSTVGFD